MAFLPLLLAAAPLASKLFGGAAQGASTERAQQNNFAADTAARQQQALLQALGLQERATMDRARLGIEAPSARTKQALLGSLLQRMQPVAVTPPKGVRMGQVSGGLNLSALSPAARAGGGELERQALQALLSKSDVPGPTDYGKTAMVGAPQYQRAGKLESALSGGSLLAALLGAVGTMKKPGGAPAGGGTLFSGPYTGVRF